MYTHDHKQTKINLLKRLVANASISVFMFTMCVYVQLMCVIVVAPFSQHFKFLSDVFPHVQFMSFVLSIGPT